MTLKVHVDIRDDMAAQFEANIGTAMGVRIFDGSPPAALATADAGTKIAEFNAPSDYLSAPSSGAVSKSGTWEDPDAAGTGFAKYWRGYSSDFATCYLQALCSQAWAANTAYSTTNQQVNNGGNVYKLTTGGTSAGSGGPTGTGTGITDGTCVWDYVGPVGMVLNNTSLAAGQPFSVDTFTLTMPNAG